MRNACVLMIAVTFSLLGPFGLPTQSAAAQAAVSQKGDAGSADPFTNFLRNPPFEVWRARSEEGEAHLGVVRSLHRYARTKGEKERGEIKAQLRKALATEFDRRLKRRRLELEWVDGEVKKARQWLGKRADERRTILDKWQEQLLLQADGLGWNEPSGVLGVQVASVPRPTPKKGEAEPANRFTNFLRNPPFEVWLARSKEGEAHLGVVRSLHRYARTKGEKERGEIKAQLSKELEREFDLKQKRRRLLLEWVDDAVKKARKLQEKRSDARQRIIDQRLEQLLLEADGLGWTEPSGLPRVQGPY